MGFDRKAPSSSSSSPPSPASGASGARASEDLCHSSSSSVAGSDDRGKTGRRKPLTTARFLALPELDVIIIWNLPNEKKDKDFRPDRVVTFAQLLQDKALFYHFAAAEWDKASGLSYQLWDDFAIIRDNAKELARRIKAGTTVLEYGPGASGKVLALTRHLHKSCRYIAVDMHDPFLRKTIAMINRQSERRTRNIRMGRDEDFEHELDGDGRVSPLQFQTETQTEAETEIGTETPTQIEIEIQIGTDGGMETQAETHNTTTTTTEPKFKMESETESESWDRGKSADRSQGISASGIQTDFSSFPEVISQVQGPKIIISLGSNLFNHPDPEAQLRPIATEMDIGDQIYLSIDCHDMRDADKVQGTYISTQFLAFLRATLTKIEGYNPHQWKLISRLRGGDGSPGSEDCRHSFCLTALEDVEIGGVVYAKDEQIEFFPCYKSSQSSVERVSEKLGMRVTEVFRKENTKMTHFLIEKVEPTPPL
jgi:hypothetical protein